jgi:hypothetical protein
MDNKTRFSHRHNSDGTVDSICHKCYLTVAKAQDESELYREEQLHTCDPLIVAWFHERPKQLKTA